MHDEAPTQTPIGGPAERLLEAADRLFYEKGYAATGINELLAAAGVAKASFYHHFRSKNELIVAYLEQRRVRWFEELTRFVDGRRNPARRILALFDFLDEWLPASDFRGCAFLNTIPEFADVKSAPRAAVRETKQGLRAYVAQLCSEAGHAEASDEVFLLLEGATAEAAALTDSWPVQAARKAVRRRLNLA